MIDKVRELISKTENTKIINTKDIVGNNTIKKYNQVILVETELSLNNGLKIIQLYIAFKEPYSVYLPKIYIDEKSYEEIKYLPHINGDLSICITEESDSFYFNVEELPQIVVQLISNAKKILRGADDENYLNGEFEKEFQAYWDIQYSSKDKSQEIGLALIDSDNFENLKGIKFVQEFGIYKYLVYNESDEFTLFKDYLKFRNIKYLELQVYSAKFDDFKPPYDSSIHKSLDFLDGNSDFKNEINKLKAHDFLVVFKNNHNELFGWSYPIINKAIKGFRPLSNWQFLNLKLSEQYYIERISFANISPKRLDVRTSGIEINRNLKVAIIGLGSVGSNLLHYLTKFSISEYCIIDPDILKVENVFRNKFGFNYLNKFKASISKNEILSKNPFTKVLSFNKNIIEILNNSSTALEQYDYRFIILGISRIEKYLIEHFINITSNKPVILIWVEPYMASGQLIYLRPDDFQKGIDLINEYPYHVLKKNQNLSKREGSCQTGYMPYSDMHLNLFLSSINVILYNLMIEKNNNTSKIFSWIGNIDELENLGFEFEGIYKNKKFTIIENEF
ncbi:ThiF family adenylyltransferase [Myroides sp. N17-2]|uniref:ThiF family adenylyltransferase n=1 Tax=Myroides sp. N17-2 TaxID=2030799 RepID=UPI000EFA68DD|nr:ThiF family adenylyltransferase [Myroides sp. N17-2]